MQKKRKVSFSRRLIAKVAVTFALSVVVCVASFSTALANTVSTVVTDGDQMYTFSMDSTDLDEIIEKAQALGLAPLGPNDICERVGDTTAVNVRRGVTMTLQEAGAVSEFIAYKGDTIEKALADNNIFLKEKDEITPAKETVITSDTTAAIKRYCTVTVFADEKRYPVSLVGATVKDAIAEAGVTVGENDSVNYTMDRPLFDNMRIRVGRVLTVNITADGVSKDYKLSAASVENAIEKAGLALGEEDVVTPAGDERITEGMQIVIQRGETREVTKTEEIPYSAEEITDENLYPEEGYVKTEGQNGEKSIAVKEYYLDGKLDHEETVSETVTKEPVNQVTVTGTRVYVAPVEEAPAVVSDSSSSGDDSGIPAYSQILTGSASAYCDTGRTANGSTASYGLVAVDPNVIPYGTQLYIETSNGYSGYFTAADTGGALQSGRILVDIWLPTAAECKSFGITSATVYVLS